MTVRVIGEWCSQCGVKPADRDGLCRTCEQELRAWGRGDLDAELAELLKDKP